jgi:hypothetical protein
VKNHPGQGDFSFFRSRDSLSEKPQAYLRLMMV